MIARTKPVPNYWKRGVTALELIVVISVVLILAAASVKPLTGVLMRIRLQNAADGIKHLALNARVRAVANPYRHCGIVIKLNTASVNDSVFAFLETPPADNIYTAGKDSLYGKPFVLEKKLGISASIPSGFPTAIVFRGDGSANLSASLVLTLKGFQDTIKVLASTGKVKVVVK